ncbi:MAG: hypothetical protein HZR80_09450 [Candidatus Heimdallarchaeota archaeon]
MGIIKKNILKNTLIMIMLFTLLFASSDNLSDGKIVNNDDEINVNNPIAVFVSPPFAMKDNYYLYADSSNRVLQIAEFVDPSNMTNVAAYPTHQSAVIINLLIEDNLLYMVINKVEEIGFEIVNITNILNPTYLGHYIANSSRIHFNIDPLQASRYEVQKQNDYCFLLADGIYQVSNDTIRIVDCSDIENLTESARYEPVNNNIQDFAVKNEYLYVLTNNEQELEIVNITDKSNPNKTIAWRTNEYFYGINYYQDYMFMYSDFNIKMYNILDPLSPVLVNTFSKFTDEHDRFSDLVFWEHYLAAMKRDFIFVYDIYDLTSNQSISEFECLDKGSGRFLVGLYNNDLLYVSRATEFEDRSLFIFDVSDAANLVKIYPEGVANKIPLPSYAYIIYFFVSCVVIQRIVTRKSKK